MNKQLTTLLIVVGIFATTALNPFFDNLFKGVNFDKLAKDIEGMLEKSDASPGKKPAFPQFGSRRPASAAQSSKKQSQIKPQINMDKKALFLDSIIIEKQAGGQAQEYNFPNAKLDSFHDHTDMLIDELKYLERNADAAKMFSTEFRERFFSHKKDIDDIVVALGFIADRKYYIRAFFMKPFEELRKRMLGAIESLKKINKRIALELRNVDEEHDDSIDALQDRLKKQQSKPDPLLNEPQKPFKRKKKSHRGAPVQTASTKEVPKL